MAGAGNTFFILLLFLLAGILAGGVWSSYQNGSSRAVTAVLALLAVMAALGGVLMLVEVM